MSRVSPQDPIWALLREKALEYRAIKKTEQAQCSDLEAEIEKGQKST